MDDSKPKPQVRTDSLEDTDDDESMRQLWWTLGSLAVGLVLIAIYYS